MDDDKLKRLRSAMDQTVFKNGEFTEEEKARVRKGMQSHQKRHSSPISRRLGSWIKPVLTVAVFLILFIAGVYSSVDHQPGKNEAGHSVNHPQKQGNYQADKQHSQNHSYQENRKEKPTSHEQVQNIVEKAKKGKIVHSDFVAGQTNIEDVKNLWGKPNKKQKPSGSKGEAYYITYSQKQTVFGYHHKNSLIFDIRSYDDHLNEIHMKDIEQMMGKADNTTFYSDASHNQKILIYNLNARYQLKWVVQRPTKKHSNPSVDHISVVWNKGTGSLSQSLCNNQYGVTT